MTNEKSYKISVGTADEYEDYVAEVYFSGKVGFIISQEKAPGEYDISIHSLLDSAADDFDYCRNVDVAKISLSELKESIESAVSELDRLKKRGD